MILELEAEKKKLQQSKALLEDRINLFEADKQKSPQEQHGQGRFFSCVASPMYNHCHKTHCCHGEKPTQQSGYIINDLTRAILNIDIKIDSIAKSSEINMNNITN